MAAPPVVVFSDFTSPFCYVTEAALWRIAKETGVEPEFRARELHPPGTPLPLERDAAAVEAAGPLAEAEGVTIRPRIPVRTRKAHEAARFARSRSVETEMRLRREIYRAFHDGGRDVGRIDVLVELAAHLGLDPTETKVVLDVDTFAAAVEDDEAAARRMGVEGVPAVLVGTGARARSFVGAHPYAELRAAVDDAAS